MRTTPVRRVLSSVVILATAVAAVVVVPHLATGDQARREARAQAMPASDEAVRVQVYEVRAHAGPTPTHALRASGTLEARRRVPLAFAVAGVVEELRHDDGDAVERGDALARLDPVPFESALERAESRVLYLEKSLARSRMLREQRALSDEEFDAQDAELTAARAELRLVQEDVLGVGVPAQGEHAGVLEQDEGVTALAPLPCDDEFVLQTQSFGVGDPSGPPDVEHLLPVRLGHDCAHPVGPTGPSRRSSPASP
jgi:multidrug efflux pump subunit AcrA (membrane-fusion protein)